MRTKVTVTVILLILISLAPFAHATDKYDVQLLIANCIYETANTSEEEKIAVVHVVLNRVADKRFPNSIKEVVMQPKQFSWTSDIGSLREPTQRERQSCTKAVLRALRTTPHSYNHYFLASIKTPPWGLDRELNAIDKHYFLEL